MEITNSYNSVLFINEADVCLQFWNLWLCLKNLGTLQPLSADKLGSDKGFRVMFDVFFDMLQFSEDTEYMVYNLCKVSKNKFASLGMMLLLHHLVGGSNCDTHKE